MANKLCRQLAAWVCLLSVVGAGLGSSCGGASYDPTAQAEFLTPVAQAREVGIRPYWLGPEFQSNGTVFGLTSDAAFYEAESFGTGIKFDYLEYGEDGGGLLWLYTYPEGGAREAMRLEGGWRVRNGDAVDRDVEVGPWEGMVRLVSSPTLEVNTVVLFVTVDDSVVEAMAKARTSGVPGDDSNPLIDGDLLIEVVAENLRPYPE